MAATGSALKFMKDTMDSATCCLQAHQDKGYLDLARILRRRRRSFLWRFLAHLALENVRNWDEYVWGGANEERCVGSKAENSA
jgi:hypothetical protein